MKTIDELRSMSETELHNEILSLRKEQFNLRMRKANGSLDKTHLMTRTRKSIAKVKTILTEKAGKEHV